MSAVYLRVPLLAIVFVVLLSGCEAKHRFVRVKGRVYVNGQVLRGMTGGIAFVPDVAKGNTTKHEPRSELSSDGEYDLVTIGQTGAPLGWYKVQVLAQREPLLGGKKDVMPKWAVPIEYTRADRSPILIEVVLNPDPESYDLKVRK